MENQKQIENLMLDKWIFGTFFGMGTMGIFISYINPLASLGATAITVGIFSFIVRYKINKKYN